MSALRTLRPAITAARTVTGGVRVVPATRVVVPSAFNGLNQVRFNSNVTRSAFAKDPIISYDELKPITRNPSDDVLLVDVREPDENALGSIPSSVNLPLSELKDALDPKYNPGEFQSKYAFKKPLPNQNIVFFCRSGKRSATAGQIAAEKGYHNVRNYEGSYLDWTKKEKKHDED